MPKRTRARKEPAPAADPSQRIIDAALLLAATRPWHEVSLADIASAAEVPLAELFRLFHSKQGIVAAYLGTIDVTVLGVAASGDSVREKLFDLIMRRFDAFEPHKVALRSILSGVPRDPIAALCAAPRFLRSIAMLSEAAGINTSGPLGALRVKGAAGVYLIALRTWMGDDATDHAKTMAALDRALNRAEALARSLSNFTGRMAS